MESKLESNTAATEAGEDEGRVDDMEKRPPARADPRALGVRAAWAA